MTIIWNDLIKAIGITNLATFAVEDDNYIYDVIKPKWCDPEDPDYYLNRYKAQVAEDPYAPEIDWTGDMDDIAWQLNQHYLCWYDKLVSWHGIMNRPIKRIDFRSMIIEVEGCLS